MNYYTVIIAGIAGGLAAGLAHLICPQKKSKPGFVVIFMILFVLIRFLGVRYALPLLEQ